MLRFYCISNWRFVYGLKKVFLGKEILILSDHSKVNKKTIFLISRICLMYKRVILNMKRKQNDFFWNIDVVLMTLINWLLKPKCMLKLFFLNFCCMKIWYDFFSLKDLVVCMKTKNMFFLFFKFSNVLTKMGYFNTRFVFYGIKIQTNINQNGLKNTRENHKCF